MIDEEIDRVLFSENIKENLKKRLNPKMSELKINVLQLEKMKINSFFINERKFGINENNVFSDFDLLVSNENIFLDLKFDLQIFNEEEIFNFYLHTEKKFLALESQKEKLERKLILQNENFKEMKNDFEKEIKIMKENQKLKSLENEKKMTEFKQNQETTYNQLDQEISEIKILNDNLIKKNEKLEKKLKEMKKKEKEKEKKSKKIAFIFF